MCAAVMFFSSCSKEDNGSVDTKEVNNQTEVNATKAITVSAKQKSSVSKVALGIENQGKYEEVFSEGDVLTLYLNNEVITTLELTDGAGKTTAKFTGEIPVSADGKTISAKILPKESPSGLTECSSFAAAVSTYASLYGTFTYNASADNFSLTLDDEVSYFVVETNKLLSVDINGNDYTVSNNLVVFAFKEDQTVSSTALDLSNQVLTAGGNVYFKTLNSILVTSIKLNKTLVEIFEGCTETLSVTEVLPDNADDKTYTWSSSNKVIATVDENGVVTAQYTAGYTTVKATANDGSGVSRECGVYVRPVASATIQFTGGVDWESNIWKDEDNLFSVSGIVGKDGNGLALDSENNSMTISAQDDKTIARVVFTCSDNSGLNNLSFSSGSFNKENTTVNNVNAKSLTVRYSDDDGEYSVVFTGVTIYYAAE